MSDDVQPAEKPADQQVMVGMASIPERVGSLERAIASLAPQVDRIALSLNDYSEIPRFLAQYPHVEVTLLPDANRGDGEKFRSVDEWEGYVASCDDDILYPPDYIETLVAGIDRYDRNYICSFHGGRIVGWSGSPITASTARVRALGTLEDDRDHINMGGTGVTGYHAGRIPVYSDVFRYGCMADVQLACHARTMGAPFMALAHNAGWLQDICPPPDQGRRIYNSNRNRDGTLCDTHDLREQEVNRFDWTSDPPGRPKVRVSIATCDRPELILKLLDDLARESQWVDLEVSIYQDPTHADYAKPRRICRRREWRWMMFEHRLGRTGYWRLIDRVLQDAKRSDADWFMLLNDDNRLVRHAIPRAIATWYRLDDPCTLTLWRVKSFDDRASWTGKRPVHGPEAIEAFNLDGPWMCRRRALEELEFHCYDTAPAYKTGSGVGRQLSMRLHERGLRLYRVNKSLAVNNDGNRSIMNPQERASNPIITI